MCDKIKVLPVPIGGIPVEIRHNIDEGWLAIRVQGVTVANLQVVKGKVELQTWDVPKVKE